MQKNRKLDTRIFLINSQKTIPHKFCTCCRKKEAVSSLAYFVPNADNVRFIDIDTLIENVRETGKVRAKLQREMVEEF